MRALPLLALALLACGEKEPVDSAEADNDGDGYTVSDGDCDDADASAYPGAAEVCDEVDNDCDGEVDLGASDAGTYYSDGDGDGFGAPDQPVEACAQPEGAVADNTDCDDNNNTIHPGADEYCDDLDHDCNGTPDDAYAVDAPTAYADLDGDGYGDPEGEVIACETPFGFVSDDTDCDDSDADTYPGADELCDGVDRDCNGTVDDDYALDAGTWYADADNDLFGDAATATAACAAPEGYVDDDQDCDDALPQVNPDAEERCDDLDNDCDGDVDWGHRVPTDYADIQTAIDDLSQGAVICVEAGTYSENIDFQGRDVTVQGTEGSQSTTIQGDGSGPVVTFENEEGSDSHLIGFTITGGEAQYGAGVYISGASPSLTELVIEGNTCDLENEYCRGVGLFVNGGDPLVMQLEVRDNVAGSYGCYGTGAYFNDSEAVVQGLLVEGNRCEGSNSSYGMLSFRNDADVALSQVIVRDNTTDIRNVYGAALYAYNGSDVVLDNVIIAGNEGVGEFTYGTILINGNGQYIELNQAVVHGNTLEASGTHNGSALWTNDDALSVTNSVLSGNLETGAAAVSGGVYFSTSSTSSSFAYTDVWGNDGAGFVNTTDPSGSDGNISIDPGFADVSGADPALWDLTLDSASPLIDAGDPSVSDPDGSTSDIGAYGGPGAADWGWAASIEAVNAGSLSEGYVVEVEGLVVTALYGYGFAAQDPNASAAAGSGIQVYTGGPPGVRRGWEVTVVGEISDYYGADQLVAEDWWVTGFAGEPAPTEVSVAEALDESYENVLITLTDGSLDDAAYDCSADGACSDANLWTVTDGTNESLILYDVYYEDADWVDWIGTLPVTGVMGYRWNRPRLQPRDAGDFQ
ncbi:MAG: hypothetical protein H6740_13785 [Alphaproteobacteria bacterium]|nr:hypothetical protein [Alphaproteobacteria bacterium]